MSPDSLSWPHLDKAPVNEALIDIRVQLPPGVRIDQLNTLHSKISSAYPKKKERRKWEGKFELKEEGKSAHSVELGIDGLLFSTSDDRQIVQYRLDGFTFSRLRPYETWESLKTEARRLWDIYKANIKPVAVSRIAVRYINQLEVTSPVNLGEYLQKPPQISFEREFTPQSLFSRAVASNPDKITSVVAQALEKSNGALVAKVLLDIDVFKQVDLMQADDPSIWEILELLRAIKNDIFFSSVTQKTLEMCQ